MDNDNRYSFFNPPEIKLGHFYKFHNYVVCFPEKDKKIFSMGGTHSNSINIIHQVVSYWQRELGTSEVSYLELKEPFLMLEHRSGYFYKILRTSNGKIGWVVEALTPPEEVKP